MEWPSKNVPKGGIFNNQKVHYSDETQAYVRTLMNESHMNMMQRNKMHYCLRNGEPLPALSRPKNVRKDKLFEVKVRPGSSKRRSLDTIRQSGAYERDAYRPAPLKSFDREKAKEALIQKMAFGAAANKPDAKQSKPVKRPGPFEGMNRFDELKKEIKEREDWLKEMEQLGEGEKYRGLIRLQILERIKQMASLKAME